MNPLNSSPVTDSVSEGPTLSGRKVVIGMFLFGFAATGVIWVYWNMHLMPFMPLQKAIVAEFEDSSPRVTGGQRKMHKHSPTILRVVMRVPFDPESPAEEVVQQTEQLLLRLRELAEQHTEIDRYEVLEVHLFHEIQQAVEQEIRSKEFLRDLKTWEAIEVEP
jgi:hypothetical protein